MPRVYIETTIPSFYFETRTDAYSVVCRNATRRWWDERRHDYQLWTSKFVLAELRHGPATKSAQALSLLAEVRVLDERPAAQAAASYYIQQKLMPDDALGDAAHLAMASTHGLDYLLTWNCKHLANTNKQPHIIALNARLGLPVPSVVTPLTLLGAPI